MNAVTTPVVSQAAIDALAGVSALMEKTETGCAKARDILYADGVRSWMIGTPPKPAGDDGKALPDITRIVIDALSTPFTAKQKALLATDPKAINFRALDTIAKFSTYSAEALVKMDNDDRQFAVSLVRRNRSLLVQKQGTRLARIKRYLADLEEKKEADAEAERTGEVRGPKSDLTRGFEKIADAIKCFRRFGDKKDQTIPAGFDLPGIVKDLQQIEKRAPRGL